MTNNTNGNRDGSGAEMALTQQFSFSAEHGSRELNGITVGVVVVLGIGAAGAVVPEVEAAITWLIAIAGGSGVAAVVGRSVGRWVRERAEDRADAAYVAAVRAARARAEDHIDHAAGESTGRGLVR